MKKRTVILAATLLCAISFGLGVASSGLIETVESQIRKDFTVVVDGEIKTFQNVNGERVYPLLYDGTTYLPVRAIGNLMGKTVYWYENEKRVELKEEKSTVTDADVIVTDPARPESTPSQKPTSVPDSTNGITMEQAKQIALERAGLSESQVVFEEREVDRDDGIKVYEIEFKYNRTEYSAEIRASDGTVLSWEVDNDD